MIARGERFVAILALTTAFIVACSRSDNGGESSQYTDARERTLRAAVAEGDAPLLTRLVREGPHEQDKEALSRLLFSDYVLCNPELIETLVTLGADPSFREGPTGEAPILLAASAGESAAKCVKKLIELGADPHYRDFLNQGLVFNAVMARSIEVLRLAISLGVAVDEPKLPRLVTPLDLAIRMKYTVAIDALAEAGADICGVDAQGNARIQLVNAFDSNSAAKWSAACQTRK